MTSAVREELARVLRERERLREELMRVGLMAVSERQDGCINKTTAARIRARVYAACWSEDGAA